jgi:hypothetical protein
MLLYCLLRRSEGDSGRRNTQAIVPEEDVVPGAVIAIQTFGDFLGFNPHCHVLYTDGGFYGKGLSACTAQAGMFRVAPWFIPKDLEKLFRYKVFKMLLIMRPLSS